MALVTPFDERGGVDYVSLGRLVDYVTENGADFLVALGTTAETPTLSAGEKSDISALTKLMEKQNPIEPQYLCEERK